MSIAPEEIDLCAVMSRPVIPGDPDSYMICTLDQGHRGRHSSCAMWLRWPGERRWSRNQCADHAHHAE